MKCIDLFIGGFPLIVLFYHFIFLLFNFHYHKYFLSKILLGLLFSKILKNIFKVKRNKIIKKDKLYKIRRIINRIGTSYSFPSTHIVFYSSYYLEKFSVLGAIFVLFACFGRVYYKHHVLRDVVFGLVFGMVFDVVFRKVIVKFFLLK